MLATSRFLVAEDHSGKLIASVRTKVTGCRGWFGMLAVDPGWQSRGIGRAMVAAAEDVCRRSGCTSMELTVLSLRTELPPFYRKLGYVETGAEEFVPTRALQDGLACHCIVMSKDL